MLNSIMKLFPAPISDNQLKKRRSDTINNIIKMQLLNNNQGEIMADKTEQEKLQDKCIRAYFKIEEVTFQYMDGKIGSKQAMAEIGVLTEYNDNKLIESK